MLTHATIRGSILVELLYIHIYCIRRSISETNDSIIPLILKGLIRKPNDCNGKSAEKLIFSNGFNAFATLFSFIKHKNTNSQPSKKDFKVDIYSFFEKRTSQLFLGGFLFFTLLVPQTASANIFDIFARTVNAEISTDTVVAPSQTNSQKMVLAEPNVGPDTADNTNTSPDTTISETTLTPKVGPLGSNLDIADIPEGGGQIGVYTVHDGDTIGSIAEMFNVSKATIISANDLTPGQSLKKGTVLAIPPVSGHIYTVKKGDSITIIAKKFKADAVDIAVYNDLEIDSSLTVGDDLIIPDINFVEIANTAKVTTAKKTTKTPTNASKNTSSSKYSGPLTAHPMRIPIKVDLGKALLRPVSINVSRRSQGAHDIYGSAVDLAAPIGTPIMAAADGTVVLAREVGYNGGYGEYVIIMSMIDGNIVQTIYAHMSKVATTIGSQVRRGDVIGYVGSTGRSTGPHVHFEVHGALNPLTLNPNYTGL
jgi:murein DD-endopeptidase MepM/ murein hydrolase activator NlpD